MGGKHRQLLVAALGVATLVTSATVLSSPAAAGGQGGSRVDELVGYWTPERVAAAQPRDLVIDGRGLGYLRGRGGALSPYGHSVAPRLEQVETDRATIPSAMAGKPPSDSTPPTIGTRSPADDATIGSQSDFTAVVTDAGSGVASVTIVIHLPGGSTQSFAAANRGGNVWGATISGFTDGSGWGWHVVAKDRGSRGGNTTSSSTFTFSVDTGGGGGGGGGGGDVVANAAWGFGGQVQLAAGRILFEMPTIKGNRVTWSAYVCSGTVVQDGKADASIILTAAHCVYDDVAKQFARNVLFIPNQDGTSGTGTDTNCGNDPIGCWAPSYGVVDANWTTRTFPNNVEWDYAYYVVPLSGVHSGATSNESLEAAVEELPLAFTLPTVGNRTHALGYSYSEDPNFMYCAEDLGVETPGVDWWLGNCGLSGGSSGGPWVQPMDESTGSGPIVSVNSWGYTNQPGMAGPVLDESAACTFTVAVDSAGAVPSGSRGVVATC